ncbi:MAG TPA: hypothetical protein VGG74_27970 [Kofleriaceae bacterium]
MRSLLVGVLVVLPATAIADDVATVRWPDVPSDPAEPLEDQIVDHLDAIGDQIGSGLDQMSDHVLTLHVDGRHNRAHVGLGHGGDGNHYLTFRIDSDWLFEHNGAHIDATVQLGLGEHQVEFKLPGMVLSQDNWHGQDLVVLDVNLLERRF